MDDGFWHEGEIQEAHSNITRISQNNASGQHESDT